MVKQKQALEDNNEEDDYSDEFYKILSFKSDRRLSLVETEVLCQRFELCQIIRDMITINESINWNLKASTNEKYRSIGSYIKHIEEGENEFISISNLVMNSIDEEDNFKKINILNIYGILRPSEIAKFNDSLSNNRVLFHGIKSISLAGILSRGILLPNYVIPSNSNGVGMLGRGIYFSDCVNTSLKYTSLNKSRNTRFIAICDVALGNCKDYYDYEFELMKAPENYNSSHGVKYSPYDTEESVFEDDEYVIYDISQQKIRYLVELQYESDGEVKQSENEDHGLACDEQVDEKVSNNNLHVNFNHEVDKLEMNRSVCTYECGLFTTNGKSVPLKSIHIRGKILDMVSKVTIFQEYENIEENPMEAKFIFPLDNENTAICDFEAFINDKHIIGICKEKEEAHREFREAVAKGFGAYLMEQENSEEFKVNIGNLPPKCRCIIKITYVAELSVENENIVFRLPNYVAPWKTFKNDENVSDSFVKQCFDSLIKENNKRITFEASINMPFDIRSIHSPTHSIDVKQTSCNAVVKLADGQTDLSETFILNIFTSTIHMPRMFVEENSSSLHSSACMISFFPEFEIENSFESSLASHVIFLIDSSNSMSADSFSYARIVLGLILKKLPEACDFNICSFGSTCQELFPFSFKNDKKAIDKAFSFLNQINPNNGNTDLMNAIQQYLLINQNELVNFVLISDGHINEPESLIATLSKPNYQQKIRFFTCSVGSNPNKHLLKMISFSTNGLFTQFDSKFQSKWTDKVEEIIDKIGQPSIGNISVEWEIHDDNKSEILQAPAKISSLFNGRRQIVYGFVPNCLTATLKAKVGQYEVSTVVNCPELMVSKGTLIHMLTAKALINDWQYGIVSENYFNDEIIKSKLKDKIVELSKEYCIASEYTSFIAIEERNETFGDNESNTPRIEDLLAKDPDASSIDILPYVSYINEHEKKLKEDHFERMLNKMFEKIDDISYDELNELNRLLKEFKDGICEMYSDEHPIRIKYFQLYENVADCFQSTKKDHVFETFKRKPIEKFRNENLEKYKTLLPFTPLSSFIDYEVQNMKNISNSEITITDISKNWNEFACFNFHQNNDSSVDNDLLASFDSFELPSISYEPLHRKTIHVSGARGGRGGKGLGKGGAKRGAKLLRNSQNTKNYKEISSGSESDSRDRSRSSSESRTQSSSKMSDPLEIINQNLFFNHLNNNEDDALSCEDHHSYSQIEIFKQWKIIKKQIDCNIKYWTNNDCSVFRSFLLKLTKVNLFI